MKRQLTITAAAFAAVTLASASSLVADPVDEKLSIDGKDMVTKTKAPEGHPFDEVLSGWLFRTTETRALEADSFNNPGMLGVEAGEAIWNKVEGSAGKSCASCHGDAAESMKGVGASYPLLTGPLLSGCSRLVPARLSAPLLSALIAAVVVGVVCSVLGTYVVLRGMAFFGDALAHTILPGVVIAFLIGWPLAVGALVVGVLAALGIGVLTERGALKEDTAIGVVFVGLFSLGIALLSTSGSYSLDRHVNGFLEIYEELRTQRQSSGPATAP